MVVKRESEQSIDDWPTAGKSDEQTCSNQISAFSDEFFLEVHAELEGPAEREPLTITSHARS
jgi:hypothetical protein